MALFLLLVWLKQKGGEWLHKTQLLTYSYEPLLWLHYKLLNMTHSHRARWASLLVVNKWGEMLVKSSMTLLHANTIDDQQVATPHFILCYCTVGSPSPITALPFHFHVPVLFFPWLPCKVLLLVMEGKNAWNEGERSVLLWPLTQHACSVFFPFLTLSEQ